MKLLKNEFMKKMFIYKISAVLLTAAFIFTACTKEPSDVVLSPKLSTSQVLNVTSDSATVVGFIVAAGDGFTERGICWDIATAPTTAKTKLANTKMTIGATFPTRIGKLSFATKYYARAYAINASGTIYGEEVSFTTLPVKATVTTTAVTSITGNSAMSGGNITVAGGSTVTARGVCYGTTHNPSVSGSKTTDGAGTGTFTSTLTSLKGNTLYYVRAYATSTAGTGYGPEVSFTTLVDMPVVTTTAVTEVTKISAVSGGNVTYDGGGTVSIRGLAWGTSSNPTTSDNIIDGGTGTGAFISNLTGLALHTTYYVRAYATNSIGTAYGTDVSFTTLADITKFWIVGGYNSWDNSDNAKYIISTATSGGAAEGFVYLTAGEIKLATDHSWDDAHTFGDNGSGGLTNPGNNITVAATGYYLIKANLSNMTYSLTLTAWGLIGDATPGGWGDETPLTYNQTLSVWEGGMSLTAAAAKFRANHDWGYNYGSDLADGNLTAGGGNIPITVAADYAITLDLSHPNAYTYSFNSWGLIGDATPGGWSTDTNMTWDGTNKVFKATANLVIGAFKFRANAAWDINYGGNLSALTPGGDNIPITVAGNYTITFDPWAKVATVTMN